MFDEMKSPEKINNHFQSNSKDKYWNPC